MELLLRSAVSPTVVTVFDLDAEVARRIAQSLLDVLDAHRECLLCGTSVPDTDPLRRLLAFASGLGGSAQALAGQVEALLPEHDATLMAVA